VVGACASTPFYLGISAWTMRKGGSDLAVLEGTSDTLACMCAVLFDFVAGLLAETIGWSGVLVCWTVASMVAASSLMSFMHE